jgi:hypothetical protein
LQLLALHCAHEVYVGVPEQLGAALKMCGGAPKLAEVGNLQQIWWSQSLLCWHCFVQVAAQSPLQHRGAVGESQLADESHFFGQGSVVGFKQRPVALRLGSSLPTEVQQISPCRLLQSPSAVQDFGHLLAGVQMP